MKLEARPDSRTKVNAQKVPRTAPVTAAERPRSQLDRCRSRGSSGTRSLRRAALPESPTLSGTRNRHDVGDYIRRQRLAVVLDEPVARFRIDQRPPLQDLRQHSIAPTTSCAQIPQRDELRRRHRLTSTASPVSDAPEVSRWGSLTDIAALTRGSLRERHC